MLIRLYDDHERDLYMQLADEIIRLIAEGELQTQDELPSIRKLASSLQVNMKTVQAAYQRLAEEGFIVQRKKATAIVAQDNFDKESWLERWQAIVTRFQNEGKAIGLTDDELSAVMIRLLRKENTV